MDSNTIITYLEQLLRETTPEVSSSNVKMRDGVTNLIDLYRISEVVLEEQLASTLKRD